MIKMEETGPDGAVKRQRLDVVGADNSVRRMHQHRPESSRPIPLHNHPQGSTLDPPLHHRPPMPHSPFTHSEGPPPAPVPEQPAHGGYAHGAHTHTTPRDPRSLVEQQPPNYARPAIPPQVRSPQDDGHTLRPLNTSFGEGEHHHYPQHPNPEMSDQPPPFTPHESHPNGYHHNLPVNHSHETGHAPPAPGHVYSDQDMVHNHPAQQHYPPHAPYSAPGSANPWARQQSYSQQPPKRSNRAQQACDSCRQRKAKCDEGKPTCSYCRETGNTCNYKEVQPAKADRAQKEIMDRLDQMQTQLAQNEQAMKNNEQAMKDMTANHDRILKYLEASATRPASNGDHQRFHRDITLKEEKSLPLTPMRPAPQHAQDDQPTNVPQEPGESYESAAMYPDEDDADVFQDLIQGRAGAVSVTHSTGVHRLLGWPSIGQIITSHAVVRELNGKKISEDYVMEHESMKGCLRLYGRGQGQETYDGGSTGSCPSPALSSASNGRSDNSSRSSAASPPYIWGANLGPPNIVDGRFSNQTDDHPGGLNPDGTLKLDKLTMDSLLQSYLGNIHVLHPFLDKTRLRRMFDTFYAQTRPSDGHGSNQSPIAYNSITHSDVVMRPSRKRKHSTEDSPRDSTQSESNRGGPEPVVERRLWTAVVLLVLALGKICAHKQFLSGPVPERERARDSSSAPTSSPMNFDSPSARTSISRIASPTSTGASDGRTAPFSSRPPINPARSAARFYDRNDRNVDVIPGLAYYTKAAEMLGALTGSTELLHVQANLLASLYMGQLANSIESWSRLSEACKSCLFIMRGLPFDGMKHERVQMMLFAYWTCYQFESDILAELDLRPSGIEPLSHGPQSIAYPSSIEDSIGGGHSTSSGGATDPQLSLIYYSSQIMMRATLNKIQKLLYPKDGPVKIEKDAWKTMLDKRNRCLESLQGWRGTLPNSLPWQDSDPPAISILDARLRGKYWGTLYIITRPLLNYALQYLNAVDPSPSEKDEVLRGQLTPTTNWTGEFSNREILRTCKMCVFAATQSTLAFDGVMDFENERPTRRPIVTNIFGTAHAQFGNMLVLAAVYTSHLRFLISKGELVSLLTRTINFLHELAPISSTLETDARILTGVLHHIDFPQSATASFSSTM